MSEKYEFIDVEKATVTETGEKKYTITVMCEWLEVSTSGYYEWRDRPESATAQRRQLLALLVKKAFDDSDETYGHRRVHAQLGRWGEHCSPELVRRLMREQGLVTCQPRPWRHNLTDSDPCAGPIPDLVCRDFTVEGPGQKMVGDITYIPRVWETFHRLVGQAELAPRSPKSPPRIHDLRHLEALLGGETHPRCSRSWPRVGCARRSRRCARR